MRSSPWLSAMLSALAALGLITCPTTLVTAQEQDDKKPAVIILRLQTSEVPGKEEAEKEDEKDGNKDADDDDDDDDDEDDDGKEMKEDDDGDKDDDDGDEGDDKESKSKKKKAEEKKAKAKKPKEKKAAKKPKSKPDQPAEERRPEPQNVRPGPGEEEREDRPRPDQRRPDDRRPQERRPQEQRPQESRRDRPDQNRPDSDRRGPDRPERGFQFRWDGQGPRPSQREEGRGGPPPEEFHRQMDEQREQLNRQRQELERHAHEMQGQADRMRREVEERAKQAEQSRDQGQQARKMAQELAERLKSTEQQLEQRSQEVRKLKVALEERERAIVELKQALAKQGEKLGEKLGEVVKPKQPQKVADPKPIDPALIGRIERLEAEIRNLMMLLNQPARPKPQPKVIEQPQLKDEEKREETSKPEVTVPDGGTIVMGGGQRRQIRMPSQSQTGPSFNSKLESLTRGIRPETSSANPLAKATDAPPPTPLPDPDPVAPAAVKPVGAVDAASVGGVGIVEGDVVALLPQEGKFVLKVSTWHDGKQVRADWVGQQVSINQGNLPAVKPGDHISLDARIEGQKGLVWGGKVFQAK